MGRKLRDYIVIWNSGVSFAYLMVGTVAILYGIDSLHLTGDFINIVNIIKTRFTSLTMGEIILMVVFGIIWLAGVTNFFYLRRCLLEYKMKSIMAFVAAFTLVFADVIALGYLFYDIYVYNGRLEFAYRSELMGSLGWVGWSAVGLACASGLFSLIGVGIMIRSAFKPVAIAENEFEKKERIQKEKEAKKRKKEHEKEKKKSTSMPVLPVASREKTSEDQMMFKSGDDSLEDEKLAEEIAKGRKNPFIKEEEPASEEKKVEEKPKDINPNGVPVSVVKENPLLTSPVATVEATAVQLSPNISSEADEPPAQDAAQAAAATPTEVVPLGGGAIDPAALGLDKPDDNTGTPGATTPPAAATPAATPPETPPPAVPPVA